MNLPLVVLMDSLVGKEHSDKRHLQNMDCLAENAKAIVRYQCKTYIYIYIYISSFFFFFFFQKMSLIDSFIHSSLP